MILHPENWMNIRRFRALHEAGASYAEIAAEVGCDWRTVKKYLEEMASHGVAYANLFSSVASSSRDRPEPRRDRS